jgi:hypothetical protein
MNFTPSFWLTSPTWTAFPLKVKDELRAMTKSCESFDSAVMMSSEMPSAKYSCSGSPLMLTNGRTAIDACSLAAAEGAALVASSSPACRPSSIT